MGQKLVGSGMLQALAVVCGHPIGWSRLGWMCKVLPELFPLLKGWRCVSKRGSRQIWHLVKTRMGVSSKAGRDHGLVPVPTLGNYKQGLSRSVVFPHQFQGVWE